MKLLTKSTLLIATLSLFLFFIMGIIFFQVLKNMSISDLNRELNDLKELVVEYLETYEAYQFKALPGIDSLSVQVMEGEQQTGEVLGDTLMYDKKENQFLTYRYLQFMAEVEERAYLVKIYKSTNPTDQLVERVTLMMTLMVILFLAGIFILNRFIFANLWSDFFKAIEKLKQFESNKEPVIFGEQDIQEFDELKQVLERCVEINRLENVADRIFRAAMAELFDDDIDIAQVIKWREIYDYMEAATDKCEDVANVLEGVALKYG